MTAEDTLQVWSPSAVLRPYVTDLVAYEMRMPRPGVHRGLPSTGLTLVLPVGEPIDVGWAGQPETRTQRWSCVSGLHTRPAEIHHGLHQAGVQLSLTPAGARALLGMPAAELMAQLVAVEDIDAGLRDLPERLAAPGTWGDRVRLVERRLVATLARRDASGPRAEVGQALARLTSGAQVSEVARGVGLTRRRLSTVFRAECGLSPKQYQRVARFESSKQLLAEQARSGRTSLASLAVTSGFADQAHLTREWTALAGCTPTTWLRTEFPFVQDSQDHHPTD